MVSSTTTSNPTTSCYKPVHVYPYSSNLSALKATGQYSQLKRLHVVRHAEGTHNVQREYNDIINLDARLTKRGKDQCHLLAQKLVVGADPYHQILEKTELVVTSPLTRCIETSLLCFPSLTRTFSAGGGSSSSTGDGIGNDNNRKFVAQESIRETVNFACDRRRPISQMEGHFHANVCFREIVDDHDEVWESYSRRLEPTWGRHRESAELHVVADRAKQFFSWLKERPEQEIVVCTHSAFLRCFLSWGQSGGVPCLMEQILDDRVGIKNVSHPGEESPVLKYCGDAAFEDYMRSDYENCELRSFVAAFPHDK